MRVCARAYVCVCVRARARACNNCIIIIGLDLIGVIFIAQYLTDKGEHAALCQNKNVYIKTSKRIII